MFKHFILIGIFVVLSAFQVCAQEEQNPVKFSLKFEKANKLLNKDDYLNAVLNAAIEKGWHFYALEKIDGGALPTRISIADDSPFELKNIVAPTPIEVEDSAFGVTTKFYEDAVKFTLAIKVLDTFDREKSKLKIKVRFQVCNDQMCLPPKTVFVEPDSQTSANE